MEKQYKIYRLILDGETVYVGQTTQSLNIRKSQHNRINTFNGIKESIIELIEITTDISRERYWIKHYMNEDYKLVNKRRGATGLTGEQHRQTEEYKKYQKYYKKKWQQKYREIKKDEINKKQREYREIKKDEINRKQREYRAKKKLEKENNINN